MKDRTGKDNVARKGFTMVELLVIVAVIGILAAVIIPAFVGVDDEAKGSSDENTVSSLNTSLDSGAAIKKKLDTVDSVRSHLHKAGYSDDSLRPQSAPDDPDDKYCFVWDRSLGAVLMISVATDEVLYPVSMRDTVNDGDWYFVERDTTAVDDCSYPSALKIAREYFSQLPQTGGDEDLFYALALQVKFEYDGTIYERVPQVAWAFYEENGTYEDGARGPKLGQINLCDQLAFDKYTEITYTPEVPSGIEVNACNIKSIDSVGSISDIVGYWVDVNWIFTEATTETPIINCELGKHLICRKIDFSTASTGIENYFIFNGES